MELQLMELQKRAKADKELKKKLLATQSEENPINAFCKISNSLGFEKITPYALATEGEAFCAEMLRSVNGGGVYALEGWDDFYGMFMSELSEGE